MILREQVLAVTERRAFYETAEDYYNGDVAESYATRSLKRAFGAYDTDARLNFCRPVVDAVHGRLEINAVQGFSKTAQAVIDETWEFNQLGLETQDAIRKTLVMGDSIALLWPDEDGNIEISFNSPLTTQVVYDPERPRRILYAVKMWEETNGTRMNVYTADSITRYRTPSKAVTEGVNWEVISSEDNPFGFVPAIHFRTERPFGRPEHIDAYDAQNYINKQFVTSMIVTDYQGAKQRWALSRPNAEGATEVEDWEDGDTDRENAGSLQNGPGNLWILDNIEKVGEFSAADPDVFWKPIKDTVRSMASLTNTPLHYFEKTGNVPSGEALRVAEAPLIKKVDRRKQSFGQSFRDLFKMVLQMNDIFEDVEIKWKEVESLDELERLDATLKKRNAGMGLAQTLRELGYDEELITQIIEEAMAERENGEVAGYERAVRVEENNDERNVENG